MKVFKQLGVGGVGGGEYTVKIWHRGKRKNRRHYHRDPVDAWRNDTMNGVLTVFTHGSSTSGGGRVGGGCDCSSQIDRYTKSVCVIWQHSIINQF
jgi:hypothetical protein